MYQMKRFIDMEQSHWSDLITTSHNKSQRVKAESQRVTTSQNCITTSHNESNCIIKSHNESKTSDNESRRVKNECNVSE